MAELIREGDNVLLFLDNRRSYLIKVGREKDLHTHKGIIHVDQLIGVEYGTRIKSSLNVEFAALKPSVRDYIFKASRKTQIMYPKDIAMVILYGNIQPGSIVVEAGAGTGALTTALAHYVKPTGRVFSYEIRQEFLEIASKNLERAGVREYVELKLQDVTQGIDERGVDAVILDLATPWLVVPHAYNALKGSGSFISFSPTIDQTVKTVEALRAEEFAAVETVECFIRRIQAEPGKTRPETLMTGHTGYITFARKTFK
ncbi:MAG: tRNA (adenine-N1)-methyltransferase [Nitrososphaerota archaeon]|nr:tRNA (adenine-N1)-methyltransferase [Candidatus Bathyarchaeota archaeon]MDW8048158.1 tRNA (adenine-N1)-methyltransferase [Nitrososphaerota archaeon]